MVHEEKKNEIVSKYIDVKNCIHNIRGQQVILDRDLAEIYQVSTSAFNQAVKRNIDRFPKEFRFQLTPEEHRVLMSQIVISKKNSGQETRGGTHKSPFAFTEQGVAMLSGVLKSKIAIQTSIRLMNAFVLMRKTLATMEPILARIIEVENKQIVDQTLNEERFTQIFQAMKDKSLPTQKIFFEGDVFDAEAFVIKYISSAQKSILLIDSWVSIETLDMLAKKRRGVEVTIVTSKRGNNLAASDISKFNTQYPTLIIKESVAFHDRFLILDDKELYLIGASLKDLGKKCFAFTKMNTSQIPYIQAKI